MIINMHKAVKIGDQSKFSLFCSIFMLDQVSK